MGVKEYEVTRRDRRGVETKTTVMLSDEDAEALGSDAVPVGESKARQPENKARSAKKK